MQMAASVLTNKFAGRKTREVKTPTLLKEAVKKPYGSSDGTLIREYGRWIFHVPSETPLAACWFFFS
jgi:hypothetical protein